MDDVTVVDFNGGIKEEIRILRAQLALLLQEKEDLLYHICPELLARYAREVGSYENRAHYQEYVILELKHRIELARAALNREQTISKEAVEEQIASEYKAFHEKLEEECRRTEEAQRAQAEKERRQRESEQRWQAKYGASDPDGGTGGQNSENPRDGDPGTAESKCIGEGSEKPSGKEEKNGDVSGEKECPSAKDLYRKIIKKLHPDVNPNATEREQELFRRATRAYEDGDIEMLQEIYDEIFNAAGPEADQEDDFPPEKLLEIKRKLESQIRDLQAEVNEIKSRNPYRYKELLDDPEKLSLVQAALQEAIRLYEEEIKRLSAELEKINREMDELRQKRG